jgi:hypothetical protein
MPRGVKTRLHPQQISVAGMSAGLVGGQRGGSGGGGWSEGSTRIPVLLMPLVWVTKLEYKRTTYRQPSPHHPIQHFCVRVLTPLITLRSFFPVLMAPRTRRSQAIGHVDHTQGQPDENQTSFQNSTLANRPTQAILGNQNVVNMKKRKNPPSKSNILVS